MKFNHSTWYLLVDGTHADPNDVAPDADGVLRHKDGLAVALRENGVPQSIGVGAVENKNVEAAQAVVPAVESIAAVAEPPAAPVVAEEAKDLKPEQSKRGYKTREAKAR